MAEPADREARRERRAWIAANHPDHGGDPTAFAEGLRERGGVPQPVRPGTRVTVYQSRSPWRRLRRLVRQLRGSQPPSRRLR